MVIFYADTDKYGIDSLEELQSALERAFPNDNVITIPKECDLLHNVSTDYLTKIRAIIDNEITERIAAHEDKSKLY